MNENEYAQAAAFIQANPNDPRSIQIAKVLSAEKAQKQAAQNPIEEQHPGISTKARVLAQNFANSPEIISEYIKNENPELETKVQQGRVLAKTKKEKQWRVLDPDTGFFSSPSEMFRDFGDVEYDLVSGLAQGAATTLGAASGGVVGAALASGASGAGLETLRQKLGQAAGLPQTISGKDIAMSGLIGAAIPAAGATIKGTGKFVANKVAPWVGEKMSGIDKELIKNLQQNYGKIKEMGAKGQAEISQLRESLSKALYGEKKQLGSELEQTIKTAEMPVDISKVKNDFLGQIKKTEARATGKTGTDVDQAQLEHLQDLYDSNFKKTVKAVDPTTGENILEKIEIPNEVTAEEAHFLQQKLKRIGDVSNVNPSIDGRVDKQQVRKIGSDLYKNINQELDVATKNQSSIAKQKYAESNETIEMLQKAIDSNKDFAKTLQKMGKPGEETLTDTLVAIEEKHNLPLLQTAKDLKTFSMFQKPSAVAKSLGGSTSTSRTIPFSVAGGSLGSLAGYKLGGGYAGAAAGGGLGAILGSTIGSPAAIRMGVGAQKSVEKAVQQYGPALGGTIKSVYELMRERKNTLNKGGQ